MASSAEHQDTLVEKGDSLVLVPPRFSCGRISSLIQRSPTVATEICDALLQLRLTTFHPVIGLHETFTVALVQLVVSLQPSRRYSAQNDAGPPFPQPA